MAQQITSINLKLFAISLHEVMSITTYTNIFIVILYIQDWVSIRAKNFEQKIRTFKKLFALFQASVGLHTGKTSNNIFIFNLFQSSLTGDMII